MLDVGKLATMNVALLTELPVDEVLQLHPLLAPEYMHWRKAQKTKPIKAKPIAQILIDPSVESKFLIETLEAHEPVKISAWLCWGIANDVWQQTYEKIAAKYTLTGSDEKGWLTFEPKPDAPVPACEVVEGNFGPYDGFSVINPAWGDKRVVDGQVVHLHYGVKGDCVLQGLNDPKDMYRVARRFFDNSYSWV